MPAPQRETLNEAPRTAPTRLASNARRSRGFALLVVLFSALAFAAACGSSDGLGEKTPSASATPAVQSTPTPAFSAASTMGRIATAGKLVVGVKFDQPGFGLKDPATGEIDGFDVAIAHEIAKALGLSEGDVEFVEAVTADRIPLLQSDQVDLVVATMTITAEREEHIDFSRPYYLAGQSILVKKTTTTIATIDDLNGRKVCSVAGSTSEATLRERAPGAILTSRAGYTACVSDLNAGDVDGVSTDDIILAAFAASDSSLKLVGGQFTQEPYGIGVKKGQPDMVEYLDGLIAQWFKDGTWDRIYNQYLGKVEGMPKAAEARAKIPAK